MAQSTFLFTIFFLMILGNAESIPKKKTRKEADSTQTSAHAASKQSTRRGAAKQALSHDAPKFDQVYEASKRRRRILIEESEEEETGNDPISQLIRGKFL
jgi:hypothetical protein